MNQWKQVPDHDPVSLSGDPRGQSQEVSANLAGSATASGDRKNGSVFYSDQDFERESENPYRDTTVSDTNLRYIPLGDQVPKPWKTFEQVLIASYVSLALFLVTGVLAVTYARRGKRHQSKGLFGMAQKESRLAVWFIYASIGLGVTFYLVLIPILVIVMGTRVD